MQNRLALPCRGPRSVCGIDEGRIDWVRLAFYQPFDIEQVGAVVIDPAVGF
jgi:hypothetical protein